MRIWLRVVMLVAMLATIGCDRVTKHMAATALAGAPSQTFLGGTVRLEYAENTGAFLGLGAGLPAPARAALFSVGNALLLLGVAAAALRYHWQRPALFGLALLVGGGLSNVVDRVMYGKVIDFMNLGVGPIRTGIFNVADVAIMLGAAVIAIAGMRQDLPDAADQITQ